MFLRIWDPPSRAVTGRSEDSRRSISTVAPVGDIASLPGVGVAAKGSISGGNRVTTVDYKQILKHSVYIDLAYLNNYSGIFN